MKRKKLTAMILSAGMAVALLAGCAGGAKESGENTGSQTEQSKEETKEEQKEIGNVVASSVAIVEILDAMDVPMAGVPTSSYELPESVADATQIGNPMSPDMEIIASLEPDYIISVNSLEADLGEQFTALGAETYYADLSSYESLKTTISDLGSTFGKEEKAEQLIAGLEEKEKSVAEKTKSADAPSVLIVFGAGNSFMSASEATYVGDLVRLAGGVNVVSDAPSGFTPIDMEYLADKNPDYILLMAHANPEESLAALRQEFENNEAWQNFDAVKNEKVYALETGYFGMSANLQAGEALEKMTEILYQEP